MNKIITTIVFTILVVACVSNSKNKKSQQDALEEKTIINTKKYFILPVDSLWSKKKKIPVEISKNDLKEVDVILKEYLTHYNKEQQEIFERTKSENLNKHWEPKIENFVIDHEKYLIQTTGYLNDKGEKIIYLSAFCYDVGKDIGLDMRKSFIAVSDGGNCFFELTINFKTKQVTYFIVNGEA